MDTSNNENAPVPAVPRLPRPDITSMLALVVSVFALAVGAWQTRLMQSQARASVWPYLSIGYSYTNDIDKNGFVWQVDNNGVGPARVQSVTLSLDGKPLRHWNDVLDAFRASGRINSATTSLSGAVIPPNTNRETTIAAIRIHDSKVAAQFKDAVGRFRMDVCYCSVYDECWIAHWQQTRIDPVGQCRVDNGVQFED